MVHIDSSSERTIRISDYFLQNTANVIVHPQRISITRFAYLQCTIEGAGNMTALCALTLHRVKVLCRSCNQGNVGVSWKSLGTTHPAVYSVVSTTGIHTELGSPGRTHEIRVPFTYTAVSLLLLSFILKHLAEYFDYFWNIACLIFWRKAQNFASSPFLYHKPTTCNVFCVDSPEPDFTWLAPTIY